MGGRIGGTYIYRGDIYIYIYIYKSSQAEAEISLLRRLVFWLSTPYI